MENLILDDEVENEELKIEGNLEEELSMSGRWAIILGYGVLGLSLIYLVVLIVLFVQAYNMLSSVIPIILILLICVGLFVFMYVLYYRYSKSVAEALKMKSEKSMTYAFKNLHHLMKLQAIVVLLIVALSLYSTISNAL